MDKRSHNRDITLLPKHRLSFVIHLITFVSLQVFISFSQLSARYSSLFKFRKHSAYKSNNVKGKEGTATAGDRIICQNSLEESLKNFDKDVLETMRGIDLKTIVALSAAYRNPLHGVTDQISTRKVSYISSDSFEKNKKGWTENDTVTVDLRKKGAR